MYFPYVHVPSEWSALWLFVSTLTMKNGIGFKEIILANVILIFVMNASVQYGNTEILAITLSTKI
jgi:hypothetical protein